MRIVVGNTEYTAKRGRNGYCYIYIPRQGWYLHHRLVVEQALGRKLQTREHVHHVNGEPLDNRLANLVVMDIDEHGKKHSTHRWRNHEKPKRQCMVCNTFFEYAAYRARTAKYCSYPCMGKAHAEIRWRGAYNG